MHKKATVMIPSTKYSTPDSAAVNENASKINSLEMVERSPEKAGVGGSIPSLATISQSLTGHRQKSLSALVSKKTGSEQFFKREGKRGGGSLSLRNGVWYVKIRQKIRGKGKLYRINLGSVEELPDLEAASAAADYVASIGPASVAQLIQHRHRRSSSSAQYTPQWFTSKLTEQGHKCAICGRTPKRLCVDHDHEDAQLRGLLCSTCNSGLGMFKDDIVLLRAAVAYLEFYGS